MDKIFRKWGDVRRNGGLLMQSTPRYVSKSNTIICRFLTSSEISTALRPFYFSVHPDLFGQYPNERSVNENSLKQLSSYIETVQKNRPTRSTTIKFYLRPKGGPAGEGVVAMKGSFRSVRISLGEASLRNTVRSILSSCNLPTTYVDNISPPPKAKKSEKINMKAPKFDENDPIFGSFVMEREIRKAREAETLTGWLATHADDAKEKLSACQPVREEVVRLQKVLEDSLGLRKVSWDCGWNITHFRGCLQSFQALARHHPDVMHVLEGRVLIFSNDTGVSLDGHVMLNSGEVRNNWLDFIKHVSRQDEFFRRIPAFESAVSRVLRDIKVVRRKFQPKVMAKHYESQLRRLTTSLSDHQGRLGYPKDWPARLDKFELVVEAEAGPLMLSPTGQFIVPSSCPAFLLVSFISEHMGEATRLLHHYKSTKHVERDLHKRCMTELGLSALSKDDNITPDLMIAFCQNLLRHKGTLASTLRSTRVWVTHYYSVMSDGEICVPWNWKI